MSSNFNSVDTGSGGVPQKQQLRRPPPPPRNYTGPAATASSPSGSYFPRQGPTSHAPGSSSNLRSSSAASESGGCGSRTIEDFVATLLQLINSAGTSVKSTPPPRAKVDYVRAGPASGVSESAGIPGHLSPSVEDVPDEDGGEGFRARAAEGEEWKYEPVVTASVKPTPDELLEEMKLAGQTVGGDDEDSSKSTDPTKVYLRQELAVSALNRIHDNLYLFGTIDEKLRTVHPLTHYLNLNLKITPTDDSEKHLLLIREVSKIYIKPLPTFLVNTDFWSVFDSCNSDKQFKETLVNSPLTRSDVKDLGKLAYGFLKSWSRLVCTIEDYDIAIRLNLLPNPEFGFEAWKKILQEPSKLEKKNVPGPSFHISDIPLPDFLAATSLTELQELALNLSATSYEVFKQYPVLAENWRLILYMMWLVFGQEVALRLGAGWFGQTWIYKILSVLAFFPIAGVFTMVVPCVVVYVNAEWGGWWTMAREAVESCNRAFGINVEEEFWVDA
ncbi:hypothetical protein DFH27DRAFT_536428 [Peziza echinospora]|nr:hypothetical protein DFH27DRAFT_536428 [Peziza echinospora]